MKATMESTSVVHEIITPNGKKVRARRWDGVTEKGVKFFAWIAVCEVRSTADNSEFERELSEHKVVRELVSFDMRML